MTLRSELYRTVATSISRAVGAAAGAGWIGSARDWPDHARRDAGRLLGLKAKAPNVGRLWFHAASVGELESIWTVAEACVTRSEVEVILTVFSPSARSAVDRLRRSLESIRAGSCVYAGYSPWEGRWGPAVRAVRPDGLITAKYEAWPELWAVLGAAGVKLGVVGARARSSLRWARRICWLNGMALPSMQFFAVDEPDARELRAEFSAASVEVSGEPRWDRVASRLGAGNDRVRRIVESLADAPRPWGVLGSIWPSDLARWRGLLHGVPGTLWVVPHRVSEADVDEVTALLTERDVDPPRTSRDVGSRVPSETRTVVVDEMGFLSELYASADWAYVGGGFGDGIHSTIEPGICGLPIAVGPKNADRFPEVGELRRAGQLSLVEDTAGIERFLSARAGEDSAGRRSRWKSEANSRLGASRRIADRILAMVALGYADKSPPA